MASIARRARARLLRRPGRLLLRLGIALAVVELLSSVPEPRATLPPIDLVNGTVDITAAPMSGAVNLTGMVPGDSFTGSVVVGNGGSGPFVYGLSTSTTDPVLGAQLDLAVWDEAGEDDADATCAPVVPAELLYGPSDLGGAEAVPVLAGRGLGAGAAERLCLRISLPLTTGNEYQGASTVATFDFLSEGDEPMGGGGSGGGGSTTPSTDPSQPTGSAEQDPTTPEPPAPVNPSEPDAADAVPAADGDPSPAGTGGDEGGGSGGAAADGQGTTLEPSTTTTSTVPAEVTTTSTPARDDDLVAGSGGGDDHEAAPPGPSGLLNDILERLAPVIRVVREVASAARFPMVLLIAMVLFLLLQDSIDRRDPKLALAPVFPEPDVEFPTEQPADLKVPPSEPRSTP